MPHPDSSRRGIRTALAISTTSALVLGGSALALTPAGAAPASPPGTGARPAAIINIGLPVILGTVAVGQTVSATIVDLPVGSLLTYQWNRNGVPIAGATAASYTPTVADYGTNLTVTIAVTVGIVTIATVTSAAVTVGPGVMPLSPVPTISGTAVVGHTLSGTPGTWLVNTRLSYQWYRGNTAIEGATSLDYTIVPADLASRLSLATTGNLTGYVAATRFSDPTALVVAGTLSPVPTVSVSGNASVGSTLTADVATPPTGATLSYQWKHNGTAIASATDASYTLSPDDLGAAITVTVTASRTGYTSVNATSAPTDSVAPGVLSPTPVPTISGTLAFGETLTANAGDWQSGTVLSYRWLRDGLEIPGATSATYQLVTADIGTSVSVSVTGAAAGYTSVTRTSAASASISASALPFHGTPSITGTTSVGATLTAHTGNWPNGVDFSYRWMRDGAPIAGATDPTYTLTADDLGAGISVDVTGALAGYADTSVVSDATSDIAEGTLVADGDSSISGSLVVGGTLTAHPATLPDGTTFAYQWLRGGSPITGATDASYQLTPADDGAAISVTITATLPGYAPLELSAAATGTVITIPIPVTDTPTVSGTTTVGETLTADPGTWSSGTTFDYQWLRGGDPITDATDSTYVLTAADQGEAISVVVTGTRSGNSPVSETSDPTTAIAAGTLEQSSPQSVSGTLAVGETLTADPGTWPSGTTFDYQWLRGTDVIVGATDDTYTLTSAELGDVVTVRITASKPGFAPETVAASTSGPILASAIPVSSTPVITGDTTVGGILTADPGTWTGDTVFAYVWKRGGITIPGATGSTYQLVAADLGQTISVPVTGSNGSYAPVTHTSDPTAEIARGVITPAPVPTVAGDASVGSTLTATAGSWPAGATLAYSWNRNGQPIAGATGSTYLVTTTDVGAVLSVTVTATEPGYTTVARTSLPTAAVPTPPVTPTEPTTPTGPSAGANTFVAPSPVIVGTTIYKKVLTAVPGAWPAGTVFGYQWLRNGTAISGATGVTYSLVVADIGKTITVNVTGTVPGSAPVTTASAATKVVSPKIFVRTPAPKISGKATAKAKLTVKVQKWFKGTKFSYQWYENGKKISHATHTTYKVPVKYVGKRITVKITAKLTGYKTVTKASAATKRIIR